jgi:serine/threonine protein kinase
VCGSCAAVSAPSATFCADCGAALAAVKPPAAGPDREAAQLEEELRAAVGDRYRIRRRIGAGGMAFVYEADDLRHSRRVAIKVLRPELAAMAGAARFLREIETAAGLNHPNVLPIHDSGSAGALLFYVMPLIVGESLRDRLDRAGRLRPDEAIRLVREIAEGLHYAHTQGVIHRDMKPDNVLMQSGHALIADFGIARAVGGGDSARLTGVGVAVGTPDYMSPEQALGDDGVDHRTDIYALGTMLFEMLAGERPFTADSPQGVMVRKISAPAPELDTERLGLPKVLRKVVARALASEPQDRYHDAAELADALTLVEMNLLTSDVRGALAGSSDAIAAVSAPATARAADTKAPLTAAALRAAVASGVITAAILGVLQALLEAAGVSAAVQLGTICGIAVLVIVLAARYRQG